MLKSAPGFFYKFSRRIILFTLALVIVIIGILSYGIKNHLPGLPSVLSSTLPLPTKFQPTDDLFAQGFIPVSAQEIASPYQNVPGDVAISGRVGIGITNPSTKLEIGSTSPALYLNGATSNLLRFNANGVAAPAVGNSRSTGAKIVLYPGTSDVDFGFGINSNELWSTVQAASHYSWYVGTSEKMRLDSSGNIGIGTTDPNANLQIGETTSGSLRINANGGWSEYWSTETNPRVSLSRDGAGSGISALRFGPGGTTALDSTLQRLPAAAGFALMGGKVGIGTTDPSNLLTINAPAGDGLKFVASNGQWASLLGSLGDGSYNGITRNGDRGIIYSNGNGFVIAPWMSGWTGLRLDTNGNVGIGKAYPGARLDVVADGIAIRAETNGTFDIQQWFVNGTEKAAIMNNGGYWNASDARLKENVTNINNDFALNLISKLQPVEFDWKKDAQGESAGHDSGFIAQEVSKVIPLATKQENTGLWGVIADKLIPYIVSSIQQLNQNHQVLTQKVDRQQQQIENLQQEIQQLKSQLNQ